MKNTAKNYKGEPMIDFGQEARAKFYSLRGKPTYDECGESYPTCFAIEVAINGEQPKFYADDESFFKKNEGKDIEIISCEEIANPNAVINAFFMEEVTPIATVYEIERVYGGAEEGGWYYSTKRAVNTVALEDVEKEYDRCMLYASNGEGNCVQVGFYYGQEENIAKQVYC